MKQRTKKRQRVTNAINAKRSHEVMLALVQDRSEKVRAYYKANPINFAGLVAKVAAALP
jgi:hypothetical protein